MEQKLFQPRICADYADLAEASLLPQADLNKERVQGAVIVLAQAGSA